MELSSAVVLISFCLKIDLKQLFSSAQYLNSYEGYNNKQHSCVLVNNQGTSENLHIDAFEIVKDSRSKRSIEDEDLDANSAGISARNDKCNKLSKGQVVEKINCDDDCISWLWGDFF